MDSIELTCVVTKAKVIDESVCADKNDVLSIIKHTKFDGVRQPLFVNKLNTTNCILNSENGV